MTEKRKRHGRINRENILCNTCIYRTDVENNGHGGRYGCYYIAHTYKKRPCPPGNACTVYIKGRQLKAESAFTRGTF